MYIDSHAHFDIILEKGESAEELLIAGMKDSGLSHAVQVGTDCRSSEWSQDFSARHGNDGIFFSAGIHPSSPAEISDLKELDILVNKIISLGDKKLLFGIGECGLDFYRMRQEKETQIRSFEFQINLARENSLPLIIHSRDAMEETLDILRKYRPVNGIMHCFSGDREAARSTLDLGLNISFAGNVTYKKSTHLHESAEYVPADRILLETDAPFLTPVPFRGRGNRPEYITHTYEFVAGLRKKSVQELAESIHNNFSGLLINQADRG